MTDYEVLKRAYSILNKQLEKNSWNYMFLDELQKNIDKIAQQEIEGQMYFDVIKYSKTVKELQYDSETCLKNAKMVNKEKNLHKYEYWINRYNAFVKIINNIKPMSDEFITVK